MPTTKCRGVWRRCGRPAEAQYENAYEHRVYVCDECADELDGLGWERIVSAPSGDAVTR